MDFIYLDLRVEVRWAALLSPLKRIKSELFSLEHQIKATCLSVIGQHDQQTKPAVKIKLLLDSGTMKEVIDLVLLWIFCLQMRTSS